MEKARLAWATSPLTTESSGAPLLNTGHPLHQAPRPAARKSPSLLWLRLQGRQIHRQGQKKPSRQRRKAVVFRQAGEGSLRKGHLSKAQRRGRGENCLGSQTEGTVSARRSWEFDHLRPDGHGKSPDFSRSVAGSELGRTTLALGQGQEPKGWAGGQAATRGSLYNVIVTTYG